MLSIPTGCSRTLDVVFILDLSGSVEEHRRLAIAFTEEVIYNLDMSFGRTRIAVITYGDDATMQFDLNTYR